jgi:osmoprotectant transport system ATP-binding protein
MVILRDISKRFGQKTALDHISLRIADRSTHVLLGPSGSGKSTLMRILLGVLDADEGTLEMDGTVFDPATQAEWSRKFGYVPQKGGLFPHLTIYQNITLVARTLRWSQARLKERIDVLAPVVSLEKSLLKRYPNQLSGGQLQRAAIMRAAFLDPRLLVLDEPLGALDPLLRREVQNELRDIFRYLSKCVILVTHDIEEAQFFGDQFTLLRAGKIVQTGSIEDLSDRPADPFVTKFFNAGRSGDE